MNASTPADAAFGPQLQGSFDFTLVFEQSIFSIAPSAVLLIAAPIRIVLLARKGTRAAARNSTLLLWLKLLLFLVLFAVNTANLALWNLSWSSRTPVAVAASALSLAEVVAMVSLVYAEHHYSDSPSLLLSIYLTISILLDIALVRSLFLRGGLLLAIATLTSAALAVKVLLLALEEAPKHAPAGLEASKERSSGLWNRTVFWWLNTTFKKGFRSFLAVDDLSALDEHLDSPRLTSSLEYKWNTVHKTGKHVLALTTLATFQASFWAAVVPRLCFTGFSFAQPFLINTIIDTLGRPRSENANGVTGGLVGATALVYLGIAFSRCHYMHYTFRLITSVRGGLVGLIFVKATSLDAATASDTASVTLMSTDVDGIASGLQKIHDIWASIIELGLGIYLLERYVGAACFLLIIPAVLSSYATGKVSGGMGPARVAWNARVQKRVSTTSSVLGQIKAVKMMGLSNRVNQLVQSLRVEEIESSKAFRMFFVWITLIANLSDQLTYIIIVAAAVFRTKSNGTLGVAEAFTTLSIVSVVSTPVVNLIAAYPTIIAGLACFGRIQTFLLTQDKRDNCAMTVPDEDSKSTNSWRAGVVEGTELQSIPATGSKGSEAITIHDACVSSNDGNETILSNVNVAIRRSTLTMIVGPVGSGKSTLLKAILGEANITSGTVQLGCGPIAYCDETAWLRLGSVRENILGPNHYEEGWYQQVLHACALDKDLSQLDNGDQSLVGSAGVALSGGQKQRLALARAVYSRTPLVVLDDIFGSLDNNTSTQVMERLLGTHGILRRSNVTVILATHATQYLHLADSILILSSQDRTVKQGSYEELLEADIDLGAQNKLQSTAEENDVSITKPDTGTGQNKGPAASDTAKLELNRKTGDWSLYKFYFNSVGTLLCVGWLLLAAGYIFSDKIPQIWLRIWTEAGTAHHTRAYFGGYLGFGLLCVLFSGLSIFYYMIIVVPKSAQHLHWLLLEAVSNAPLWFFTTVDTSTILNRFSQDMTLVDQVLPMAAFTTTYDVFNVIAGTAIIASGATYVAAIIPFCILAIYFIQSYYLRTSRQMRHLDLETKAPLYRLFTETAAGIVTVRAFGWTDYLKREHLRHLDHSQKPYYMMYCIQRWLNVVMDLFVAAVATILVGLALGISGSATQGSIGLAMLNVMQFNQSLSMLINSWTGLETSLGAIARLKSFLADTQSEEGSSSASENQTLPPADWPQRGHIKIDHVTARYNPNDTETHPALQDVTLELQPGDNVLIIGRTGSGKSSLLLTLLHLLELDSGTITIDGLDIAHMPRQALRERILSIPQDPLRLPGSIRYNLSSTTTTSTSPLSSSAMEQALSRVGLWDMLSSRGGLDADMSDLNLSGGQKQLFALARAILVARARKRSGGGVVLLDEPTSAMDGEMGVDVGRIVREEFAGYTVVTVSHRLEGMGEADVVVRMDGGRVVEVTRKGG